MFFIVNGCTKILVFVARRAEGKARWEEAENSGHTCKPMRDSPYRGHDAATYRNEQDLPTDISGRGQSKT